MALPRAGSQSANIKALAEALATLITMASHSVIPNSDTDKNDSGELGDMTSNHKEPPK